MPFDLPRDRSRVPFEPVEDAVGVVMRNPGERDEDEVVALADGICEKRGAEEIRSTATLARSGIRGGWVQQAMDTRGVEASLDELAQK